ncbi:phage tail tape measure protein [Clostridium sp. WILCCON 0269]|uniref:Phage tail tape measure protein n=1 Tax=Candidatus Clostridium eludens TaxID=3381663 RepID=A0ABW8SPV9_9CLOT
MLEKAYELAVYFSAVDRMSGPIASMATQLGILDEKTKAVQERMNGFKNMAFAGGAITLAGAALVHVMENGVEQANNFITKATIIKDTLGATADQMDRINNTIRNSSGKGIFSISETQDFAKLLATSGLNTNQLNTTLPVFTQFAEVQKLGKGADPNTSIQQAVEAAHTVGAYDPKQLLSFLDKYNKATFLQPGDSSQFADTFKYVASRTSGMNVSSNDMLMMSALANRVGLAGSIGGTESADMILRTIPGLMSGSGNKDSKQTAALKQLGLANTIYDKNGQFEGVANLIDQLSKARNKFNPEQFAKLAHDAFGQQGMGIAEILASPRGKEQLDALEKQMKDMKSISQMQEDINKTPEGQMMQLSTNISNIKLDIWLALAKILNPIFMQLNNIVNKVQEFSQAHPEIAKLAAEFLTFATATALVIGPLLVLRGAFGWLKESGSLAGGLGLVKKALLGLVDPLGIISKSNFSKIGSWLLTPLTGLGKAIGPLGKVLSTAGLKMLKPLSGPILATFMNGQTLVKPLISTISGSLGKVGSLFSKFLGPSTALGKVFGWLTAPLRALGGAFMGLFSPMNIIIFVIGGLVLAFVKLWQSNSDFRTKVTAIWDSLKTFATSNFGNMKKTITEAFEGIWKFVNTYILPIFEKLLIWIVSNMPAIEKVATSVFREIIKVGGEVWNFFKKNILPILADLFSWIKQHMPQIESIISNVFKIIVDVVSTAWTIFSQDLLPILKILWDFISPTFPVIGKIVKGAFDIILDVVGAAVKIFKDLAEGIKTAIDWLSKWSDATGTQKTGTVTVKGSNGKSTGIDLTTVNRTGIPGNAQGTNNWSGGLTWIGEKGPELLNLPSGSQIIPNNKIGQILNSGGSSGISDQATKWGQDIPTNLATGINNNTKTVTDAVTDMATKIKELIHFSVPDKGPLSDAASYGPDMLQTFGKGITDNTNLVTTPTTNMSTNVKTIFTNLRTQSLTYGQQVVQQLGQGIQDSTNNLVNIVKTLTDKVIEQFKSGFGIHSPSKVMYGMGTNLMQGLVNGMSSKDMEGFVTNWIGSMTSAAGGAVSGNLSGWITAAMALTGVSSDWFSPLATLIQHESGGDPMSINLWDSNAAAGHPSKGLMQLIDENMSDYHLPGMDNIYDPISNIATGIKLIQHDYGSIFNTPGIRSMASGGGYVGYANGGIATQPSIFGEGKVAEMAIPLKRNNRSKQLLSQAEDIINGGSSSSGNVTIEAGAIVINAQPGQSAEEIAQIVMKEIGRKMRKQTMSRSTLATQMW